MIAHNPRGRGLARWQRRMHFAVRCVRPGIAPVSGTLKRTCGLARARCFTRTRNAAVITFEVLAFDRRRAITRADAG